MQIGEQIGISDFVRYQKIFNFGSKTGIDLPGESSGVLFTEDEMGPVEPVSYTHLSAPGLYTGTGRRRPVGKQ